MVSYGDYKDIKNRTSEMNSMKKEPRNPFPVIFLL